MGAGLRVSRTGDGFRDFQATAPGLARRSAAGGGGVSLAGVVLAITAGGALASVETTVLMTVEEMLEALAKGKDIGYRRPGE